MDSPGDVNASVESGSEAEQLTDEEIALAAEALLVEAQLARDDLVDFFSLVMREETSQEPIVAAPHQRVLLRFVWAHPRCVLRLPSGGSKTFCMAAITLFLLGLDPTVRGALVSETQYQAAKPLKMVADYITQPSLSAMLNLVFPRLRRSIRSRDPWTQTVLTVDRPPGIRDPSLIAVGTDGALPGARLAWVIIDDVLSRENTATKQARDKVHEFVDSTVFSRLDPVSRCVCCNTPWDPDDLTYRLERAGWPTLTMDAEGGITLSNVPEDWDTDDIRPSREPGDVYRLAEHDPDPEETKVLWDLKYSVEILKDKRDTHLPHRYDQLFRCLCRSDSDARCQRAWVDKCKRSDIQLVSRYEGTFATVTGVDLGIGLKVQHDMTAFVTLELRPEGKRRILDVEIGRWKGPEIVAKIIRKQRQYNSIVRVENNAAQEYIRQFVLASNASVPVKAQTTGKNRADPSFGVESIFVELSNGAWEIPCDAAGRCHKHVQALIDGWLFYEPPPKHTHDAVMAAWFAREQARALGDGLFLPESSQQQGGLGMSLLAR